MNLSGSLHYHEMGDPQMGCCNRTKVALLNALRENSSIVELQYDFKTAFSNPKSLSVVTDETSSQAPPKHTRQSSICDAAIIEGILEVNRKKKLNGDPALVQQELTTANEMLGKMLKEFEKFQTRPARDLRVKLEKISSSLQQDFTKLSKPGSKKLQTDPKVESEAAVVFSITGNKTNGQKLLASKVTNKAKNGL